MLAWWRNACTEGAGLRVVAVREGDRLLAIAPFWAAKERAARSDYEALSARLAPPAGPLAAPGREREVAEAAIEALAGARPRPAAIRFWSREDDAAIGAHLAEAAAERRYWVHARAPVPLPIVSLRGDDFDGWLATRSSKFRQESRRLRRRLDDTGARFERVGLGGVDRALRAFVELHGARWQGRGGSNALITGLREMLTEAAEELLPGGRLRIFTIEAEGKPIAVNILVAAGVEVAGWNSGFDQGWHRYSPSMLLTQFAIADAIERGEARVCLGPGETDYKRRLADARQQITMTTLVPRDPAYPLTRLRLAPYQARTFFGARLSPQSKRRLRRLIPGSSGG
jgi:CelD/BcsL family acetyltransferase involved in cellulose biosynthesis